MNSVALSALGTFLLLLVGCAHSQPGSLEQKLEAPCPNASAWLRTTAGAQEKRDQSSASPSDPETRSVLLAAAVADESAREGAQGPAYDENIRAIDRKNLALLYRLNAKERLPKVSEIGDDGVRAFWLLVQHAHADQQLQKSVLAKIDPATPLFSKQEIALLHDRVAVREGRLQRFATQLMQGPSGLEPINGIENPSELDERRKQAGLMPLTDYLCMMRALQSGG